VQAEAGTLPQAELAERSPEETLDPDNLVATRGPGQQVLRAGLSSGHDRRNRFSL
jgi:hypothetical protein